MQLEKDLLSMLRNLSDAVLLNHLWLSAEVDSGWREEPILLTEWPGLAALVARVEQMQRPQAVGHWLAFEGSRLHWHRDKQPARAYSELNVAAQSMSDVGVERTRAELFMAELAYHLTGSMRDHVLLAQKAVAPVPDEKRSRSLRQTVSFFSGFVSGSAGYLRAKLSEKRAARKRHDLGAVEASRQELALQCCGRGCTGSAYRYLRIDRRALHTDAQLREEQDMLSLLAPIAMKAGRYAIALRFIELASETLPGWIAGLYRMQIYLRLGLQSKARAHLCEIEVKDFSAAPSLMQGLAVTRRRFDLGEGVDPLPALHGLIATAIDLGVDGASRRLLEWELALLTLSPLERVDIGTRLLKDMLASGTDVRTIARLQLEVAEANALAGNAAARALALDAARELRRGRAGMDLSFPEGLTRCAKLLEPTDPQEAAALLHVARRWVRQALPHVPDFARDSFVHEVPVNRVLLSEES